MDKILSSNGWSEMGGGILQTLSKRLISNYFPIMLEIGAIMKDPNPFIFENIWLKATIFKEIVHVWWNRIQEEGSNSFRIYTKFNC